MENSEIIQKIKIALATFKSQDSWLTAHDLSERSIAHRIACYLEPLFDGYNVDCEYNGDILQRSNRKAIQILKEDLEGLNLIRENDEFNEDNAISRSVFPDVIIHHRGDGDYNLCAIEIKKSSNNISFDYDQLKLECYTSAKNGNGLAYKLGVFIKIIVNTDTPTFEFLYYKNGIEINIDITTTH